MLEVESVKCPTREAFFPVQLSNYGNLLWRTGRFAEVEAAYREALAIVEHITAWVIPKHQ